MSLYDRIDAILTARKMSRRQLAIKANIAPSTLQSAMVRRRNMTIEMVDKIAKALDVSDDLLRYGFAVDREYGMILDILSDADIEIEEAGMNWGNGPAGDVFYVYRSGNENDKSNEIEYGKLVRIVKQTLAAAEVRKERYVKNRLETELFGPHGARTDEYDG